MLIMKSMAEIFGLMVFINELCDLSWLEFVPLTSNHLASGLKVIFIIFGVWFLVTGITILL